MGSWCRTPTALRALYDDEEEEAEERKKKKRFKASSPGRHYPDDSRKDSWLYIVQN